MISDLLIILVLSLIFVFLLNRVTDSFGFSRAILKSFNLYDRTTSIRLAISELIKVIIYAVAPVAVIVFALISFGWTL